MPLPLIPLAIGAATAGGVGWYAGNRNASDLQKRLTELEVGDARKEKERQDILGSMAQQRTDNLALQERYLGMTEANNQAQLEDMRRTAPDWQTQLQYGKDIINLRHGQDLETLGITNTQRTKELGMTNSQRTLELDKSNAQRTLELGLNNQQRQRETEWAAASNLFDGYNQAGIHNRNGIYGIVQGYMSGR